MLKDKKTPQQSEQKDFFSVSEEESLSSIVPYEYPLDKNDWSGIVLVGEAPGKEEARLSRPFVGRSGKLLDETLQKAGIDRQKCLVANVFRVRPPNNKVDHFFSSRRAAQIAGLALAEEYGAFGSARCLSKYASEINELSRVLKVMSPRIIVALGRTPLWALTGENTLLSKVGQQFECRLAPGIPVMATYHPSYILRGNWGLQPQWIEHFIAAVQ